MRGRRVFVTGGTGFVGTWFVEAFAAANRAYELDARAVLLSRDPDRFARRSPHLAEDPAIALHRGDAATFDPPAGHFDLVVHAATEREFPPDRDRPLGTFAADIAATVRVLDFARDAGVRRLLFTSSGAVYGRQPLDVSHVDETYAGAPSALDAGSAYGLGKRASEFACCAYGRACGFDAVVARLFAFVGPHLALDAGYAVGNFLGDVLANRSIRISGDGTPLRSYLYGADLAIWLWTLLLGGRGGRAYNVGSPKAVSIRELAQTVVVTLAPSAQIEISLPPAFGVPPARYVPSTTRAETEFGLRAWISLDDALRRTSSFLRQSEAAEI